ETPSDRARLLRRPSASSRCYPALYPHLALRKDQARIMTELIDLISLERDLALGTPEPASVVIAQRDLEGDVPQGVTSRNKRELAFERPVGLPAFPPGPPRCRQVLEVGDQWGGLELIDAHLSRQHRALERGNV